MPSLFGAQVAALMIKDLKIARNNRKGTAIELVFPLLMGAMTGLFILLFNSIESGGSEYSDNDPIATFNESVGVPRWLGYHQAPPGTLTNDAISALLSDSSDSRAYGLYLNSVPSAVSLQQAFEVVFDTTFNHTAAAVYSGMESAVNSSDVQVWGATFGDTKVAIKTFMKLGLIISNLHLMDGFNFNPTVQWLDLTFNLRAIFSSTGAVLLIYAFIPALTITAGRLVEDKRVKARETLKVMGCTDTAYLLASALSSTLRMAIGVTMIALVLAAFGAISGSEIPLVMGISLLFAWSLIAFAQITPSVTVTPIWANVMCIVLLAGGAVLSGISTGWTKPLQLLMCLMSPIGFYYGILPSLSEDTVHLLVTPADAAVMLVIDTLLYILIGNYIYAINPGDFGVPKHPLFFISWMWTTKKSSRREGTLLQNETVDHSAYRVVLQNLTKFYGSSSTPSVDNLSISIKVGEIYALLGHNGAGKTTTMSILTGMITPSSYDVASIGGHDISEEMDQIRESVGLCPQFDVLFSDLSARDHLLLFARIKGVSDAEGAAQRLLDDLELPTDNQRCETFSGGMKRRLSVGNAIVGGASLLFLDEPSSGMDPLSRRQMWDLLKRQRDAGKTIVLTTHFMEEADYLGDRIAIMSRGRLFCCATSSELKHQYGTGFTLTAAKASSCDVAGIRSLLEKHVQPVKTLADGVGDVSFELPSNQLSKFADMLTDFERDQRRLGVTSYGVTMSTLEDVFVAISSAEEKKYEQEKEHDSKALHLEHHATLNDAALETVGGEHVSAVFDRAQEVPQISRVWSQTKTVFFRKWKLFTRSRRMQLMIILFPIFFLSLAFISVQPQSTSSASSFDKTDGVDVSNFNYVFVSPRDQDANDKLIDAVRAVYMDKFSFPITNVFKVEKYGDFATGFYLPVESVSFIEGFKSPRTPCGVIVHENRLSSTPPSINATLLWNPQFDAVWASTAADLFRTAVHRSIPGWESSRLNISIQAMPFGLPTNRTGRGGLTFDSTKLYNVMQVGMYMVLSIGQIVASCAIPVSDEISRQVYHTNMALGMAPFAYFLGNFLFDLLMCVYPFLLFVLGVYWKDMESYHSGALLICIIAGLVYCSHAILQSYIFVTYLQGMKPYVYTVMIHAFNLATMGGPYLTDVALNAANFGALDDIRPYLLSIFPSCAWYRVIDEVSYFQLSKSSASAVLTFHGIRTGWTFLILIAQLSVPILVVRAFANASGLYKRWAMYRERVLATQQAKLAEANEAHHRALGHDGPKISLVETEDTDVAEERQRVESLSLESTEDMAVMKHLRKQYGDAKVALKDLSLGIRRGECFGLLGPNGAGKSTACKLILRQIEPTAGDVHFPYGHVHAGTPQLEAFQHARLGVCQQTDTLWEYLDAAEHMDQYLRLRLTTEYDPTKWQDFIHRTIERVQLADAGTKQAGGYSGGMKRKLQVCLAMYTGARCVFLDEPSTGMDPFARRALWKVILDACRHDCCVVLTTHSMEEAEAVCSRISIITSGTLKCIGTTQHLKTKFGSGYVITVTFDATKVTPTLIQELKNACREKFGPTFEVKEELGTLHRYGVQSLSSLAEAFRFLNTNASRFAVDEYSVTQTASLEQIFLSFVSTTRDN